MNQQTKELLLIAVASVGIFWVIKPRKNDGEGKGVFGFSVGKSNRPYIQRPNISPEALEDTQVRLAYEALCAYVTAYNEGQSETALDAIKNDFETDMGIIIFQDLNGKLGVMDTQENVILSY